MLQLILRDSSPSERIWRILSTSLVVYAGWKIVEVGRWIVFGHGRYMFFPHMYKLPPIVPVGRLDTLRHITKEARFPIYVSVLRVCCVMGV
eukprot:729034-Hanusia_phi.AAC.1